LGERCPKKNEKTWENQGENIGNILETLENHGKNHGKSLFFTSEILGNNDVRESGPVP